MGSVWGDERKEHGNKASLWNTKKPVQINWEKVSWGQIFRGHAWTKPLGLISLAGISQLLFQEMLPEVLCTYKGHRETAYPHAEE